MHSFYDFAYVIKLPLKSITRLLVKAKEKENEERLINRWILGGHEQRMSYKEFKDTLMHGVNSSNKSEEEILTDVKDIINTFNEKVVR